jgi:gliding motility-associated-like protein
LKRIKLYIILSLIGFASQAQSIKPRKACRSINDNTILWSRVPNACTIIGNLILYGRESIASPFIELSNTVNPNNFTFTHLGANLPTNKDWSYYFTYQVDCGTGVIIEISDTISVDVIQPEQSFLDSISVEPGTNRILIGWQSNKSPDFGSYSLYNYNRADPRVIENYTDTFFADGSSGNPSTTKLRYEITSLDSCGNRNPLNGNIHQTILLTATTDTCAKTCTINWSHYEGWTEIDKYYILRYNTPDQIILDSVNGNTNTYTIQNLDRIIPYSFFVRAVKKDSRRITSSSNTADAIAYFRIEPIGQYISNVSRENNSIEIKVQQKGLQNKRYLILERDADFGFAEITKIQNNENTYVDQNVSVNKRYQYRVIAVGLCNNVFDTSNVSGNIVLELTNNDPSLELNWNKYFTWNKDVKEYIIKRASGTNVDNATNFMAFQSGTDTFTTDVIDKNQAVCYYVEAIENDVLTRSKSNIECLSFSGNIYWPNAISPNGTNKVFMFYGIGINLNKTEITIYNRWGDVVYQSNSLLQGWEGTDNNGNSLPTETYFFKALISQNEKISEQKGTITILR